MTKVIQTHNLSYGWLEAMEHLLKCGGKDINVIVQIDKAGEEDRSIRQLLDNFLATQQARNQKEYYPVITVANTIFPQALYNPKRNKEARPFLYKTYNASFSITKRLKANQHGTYFNRMISWSGKQGKVNQLEKIITRLRAGLNRSRPLSSAYEIGISDVEAQDSDTEEIRIYQPGYDNNIIGFPCLSHISLTFHKQQLHLTALYRNQYFISKAYGNYLGLSRLLHFLCQEIECEPGELVCIASHADAELSLGKNALTSLIRKCKAVLASKLSEA